jgi:tetratricopeptide (TPR) repeat protein
MNLLSRLFKPTAEALASSVVLQALWRWLAKKPLEQVLPAYFSGGVAFVGFVGLFVQLGDLGKGWLWATLFIWLLGLVTMSVARIQRRRSASYRWTRAGQEQQTGRERIRAWALPVVICSVLTVGVVVLYRSLTDDTGGDGDSTKDSTAADAAGRTGDGGSAGGRSPGPGGPTSSRSSLAILPFSGADPKAGKGLAGLLHTNLRSVVDLETKDENTVLFWWDSLIGNRHPMTWQQLKVARHAQAHFALTGKFYEVGQLLEITAQVYDVPSEIGEQEYRPRQELKVSGAQDSVLVLVNDLCKQILLVGFNRKAGEIPQLDVGRALSDNLAADTAYFAGEEELRRSHWDKAIAHYKTAATIDSTFGLALLRLSLAHGWKSGVGDSSSYYAERALRHAHGLPEPDSLLVRGNWEYHEQQLSALQTFRTLTTRYPQYARGWYQLGEAYYHIGARALFPREEMRRAFRRAIELDPSFGPAYIHQIQDAFETRDSVVAAELLRRYRLIEPSSTQGQGLDLAFALVWGDSTQRKRAVAMAPSLPSEVLQEALTPLKLGGHLEPATLVAGWLRNAPHEMRYRRIAQRNLAAVHIARGQLKEALEKLLNVPGYEGLTGWDARTLMTWNVVGLLDADSLTRKKALDLLLTIEPVEPMDWFLAGAHAVRQGDTGQLERSLAKLDSLHARATQPRADSLELTRRGPSGTRASLAAGGDSVGRSVSGGGTVRAAVGEPQSVPGALAQALRGLKASQEERTEPALRELIAALPGIPGFCDDQFCLLHAVLRLEVGRLLIKADSLDLAQRYLESVEFGHNLTAAHLLLGMVHDRREEASQARVHYTRFVQDWKQADASLLEFVKKVEERLAQLKE